MLSGEVRVLKRMSIALVKSTRVLRNVRQLVPLLVLPGILLAPLGGTLLVLHAHDDHTAHSHHFVADEIDDWHATHADHHSNGPGDERPSQPGPNGAADFELIFSFPESKVIVASFQSVSQPLATPTGLAQSSITTLACEDWSKPQAGERAGPDGSGAHNITALLQSNHALLL